jgi:Protein of unknown function (DUF3307)
MAVNVESIFILLIVFQIKHFVADFPLQREYMLKKTVASWGFVAPLSLHCLVHAVFTLLIVMTIRPSLWWLSIVDFVVHFVMDRIKSGPNYLGRFNDRDKPGFWNALGFDQMVHHLTGFAMIWLLIQP